MKREREREREKAALNLRFHVQNHVFTVAVKKPNAEVISIYVCMYVCMTRVVV